MGLQRWRGPGKRAGFSHRKAAMPKFERPSPELLSALRDHLADPSAATEPLTLWLWLVNNTDHLRGSKEDQGWLLGYAAAPKYGVKP